MQETSRAEVPRGSALRLDRIIAVRSTQPQCDHTAVSNRDAIALNSVILWILFD